LSLNFVQKKNLYLSLGGLALHLMANRFGMSIAGFRSVGNV